MASPERYMEKFTSFASMLRDYPVHTDIDALQMGVADDGDSMIMLCLRPGYLTRGAAELIEWRRTLCRPVAIVERSPKGDTASIAVVGQSIENDVTIAVWVCHIPYDNLTPITVAPDAKEGFNIDLLELWAIGL